MNQSGSSRPEPQVKPNVVNYGGREEQENNPYPFYSPGLKQTFSVSSDEGDEVRNNRRNY